MRAATKTSAEFNQTLRVPDFLRLERNELHTLLHVLRDPLTTHAYLLMLCGSVFETGEFLGGYLDLMAFSTPPKPERGARMTGPTYDQLRRVISDLEALALAVRDTTQNRLQGQLRLRLTARMKKRTPDVIQPKVQPKVKKTANPAPMRVAEELMVDSTQGSTHGIQGLNSSFNGSNIGNLSTDEAGELTPPAPPYTGGEQQPSLTSEGVLSNGAQAAKAQAAELKVWMAERAALTSKEKFAATKAMPTGTKPNRTGRMAPPARQKADSMVAVVDLL